MERNRLEMENYSVSIFFGENKATQFHRAKSLIQEQGPQPKENKFYFRIIFNVFSFFK